MIERNSETIQEIGKSLWSIFPKNASMISFVGRFYSSGHQCGPEWFDRDGKRMGPSWGDNLDKIERDLARLALELQRTPPFDREPFTHMRLELTDQGKMNVSFAYIPEWDSWPGLFMKGVSDVPEEEARERPRFYKRWQECRARREKEPY